MNMLRAFAAAAAIVSLAGHAAAAEPSFSLTIKDHRFVPEVLHMPAGAAFALTVINSDATAEEFDSSSLKVEKVVAGNTTGNVRIRPLAPGRYPFIGEFHSATAQGVVIAE